MTSRIGSKAPDDCRVVRLTEQKDMTSDEGVEYALGEIKKTKEKGILLWASIPCSGGSSWQHINMA
eukprot:10176674-Prorocentrum_lima.AAC.1